MLQRASKYLSLGSMKLLYNPRVYNTIVLPHFDYCAVVWGTAHSKYINLIEKQQKRAARLLLKPPRFSRSLNLFAQLGWLPFKKRVEFHRGVLVYKSLHNLAPPYLASKFTQVENRYTTRSQQNKTLLVPKPNIEQFRRSFSYMGTTLWNSLPQMVKDQESLAAFKKAYSKYLSGVASHEMNN